MPDGIPAKDVKFLGVVQSYNEAKGFGLVVSDEATFMWGHEIYAFRDVLAKVDANVGDAIRFGIHLNTKGLPQVSLPIFKVGEDGQPIDLPPGTSIVNCEECALQDPTFLEKLKAEIEGRSAAQNFKRKSMGGPSSDGKGMGKGMGKDMRGGMDMEMGMAKRMRGDQSWGQGGSEEQWGGNNANAGMWGGAGNFGGNSYGMLQAQQGNWNEGFTLHIAGLPAGVEKREVSHIFRQYTGFQNLRLVPRGDHTLGFVTFETAAQAKFVSESVTGYVFDDDGPAIPGNMLTLSPANKKFRD